MVKQKFIHPLWQLLQQGTKYGNSLQNECVVTIDNLDKQTQDYLLTETSPYNKNRTPKTVTVRAGRESYGNSNNLCRKYCQCNCFSTA